MPKLLTLFFITQLAISFAQVPPQLPDMEVFGKVKFISISSELIEGDYEKMRHAYLFGKDRQFGNKSLEYDSNGYWKKYLEYNSEGNLEFGQVFKYDSLGYLHYEANLDSCEYVHFENFRTFNEKMLVASERWGSKSSYAVDTYTYNADDSLIQIQYLKKDGNKEIRTYSYAKNYQGVTITTTDSVGALIFSREVKRDKLGRTLSLSSTHVGGRFDGGDFTFTDSYTYKKGGRYVEKYSVTEKKRTKTYSWVYDKKGRVIEETNVAEPHGFCGTFTTTIYKYEYDEQDRCIYSSSQDDYNGHYQEHIYDENGNYIIHVSGQINSQVEYVDSTFYSYDQYGNLLSETTNKRDGTGYIEEFHCIYEYDKRNNWIRRDEYQDGKLFYTSTRTFEYYD